MVARVVRPPDSKSSSLMCQMPTCEELAPGPLELSETIPRMFDCPTEIYEIALLSKREKCWVRMAMYSNFYSIWLRSKEADLDIYSLELRVRTARAAWLECYPANRISSFKLTTPVLLKSLYLGALL